MNRNNLKFLGNHTLDFAADTGDALTRYITLELRSLEIPKYDELLLSAYDRLNRDYQPNTLEQIYSMETWMPLSFPKLPNSPVEIKNKVLVGQMGLVIWFTPHYIEFSSAIENRAEWYSPQNCDAVNIWRGYFYSVINRFGGDCAIYITDRQVDKYYHQSKTEPQTSFPNLANTLIAQYGTTKKTLFDYANGKYPKYYIDQFPDLK